MTQKQAKELWPIIKEWSEGKTLQFRTSSSEWIDIYDGNILFWTEISYRIKPEPKIRPWKPEEVPVGALLRRKLKPETVVVILGVKCYKGNYGVNYQEVIVSSGFEPYESLHLSDLMTYHGGHNGDRMEHSLDHGKTWLPCGVAE